MSMQKWITASILLMTVLAITLVMAFMPGCAVTNPTTHPTTQQVQQNQITWSAYVDSVEVGIGLYRLGKLTPSEATYVEFGRQAAYQAAVLSVGEPADPEMAAQVNQVNAAWAGIYSSISAQTKTAVRRLELGDSK
jgi:hypothetical protein